MAPEILKSALPVKGILFDLDNTLYDRDLAFNKWASGFVAEQFSRESDNYRAQVLRHIIEMDDYGRVARRVLFSQVRAYYPTITEEMEVLCQRFYREWLVQMTLDPATEELLDFLDQVAIPFGIITNGPVQHHEKIRQLNLHHRTRCLFVSAEFGCNKPDPAIFRAAASCLGVPCEHILFVGDNPHADICGAHAVGMQTAWLPCGSTWPIHISEVSPNYVIGSLSELLRLVAD